MTWDNLLTTLDNMTRHATEHTEKGTAKLEQDIAKLGQIARDLADAPPLDHTTYLKLHAAVNRLTTALPAERNTIRQKITGLVRRSHAQQAYNQMEANKVESRRS